MNRFFFPFNRRFLSALLIFIAEVLGALPATCAPDQAFETAVSRRAFGGVQPRLSPDGNSIALSYQGAICRMPSNGGILTRLTTGEGFDVEPAWSPDGKTIAYINSPNFFGGELRLLRAEDGSPVKLPVDVYAQGQLWFHPDGHRVFGKFNAVGQPVQIAGCDLANGEIKPVAGDWQNAQMIRSGRVPFSLSNDGKWIVYVLHRDVPGEQDGNDGPQAEVWKVPADGGAPEKVVRFPARIYSLCWDASDHGLYATTDLGASHNDIWHIPLDDPLKGARKMTFGQADEDWPSISRDGRLLVHTENHEGATSLARYDPIAGERRVLAIDGIDFREPTATLHLKAIGKSSGEPLVAKVSLKRAGGKFHAPVGALYRVTNRGLYFYCRNEMELTLPAGKYALTATRGLEYRASESELDLKPGQSLTHTIPLERWTDMAASGWYSGENHVHANYGYGAWYHTPVSVLDQCEGEDLNVCNVMVANSDGDGVFDREFFRGRVDTKSKPLTILFWNEEFRSTIWGHMTLINLQQLVEPIFTGFTDTTNPWDVPTNADIADRTRQHRGVVSYTHPANNPEDLYLSAYSGKGLPVDVALGRIDTLDVMGNGYEASVRLWYRLLNCGFRLPAAAGTDCFLNRIPSLPPGWGRAYVKLTNGLSYDDWIAGQMAGRSFVSNGPMLEFSVDGTELGHTIQLSAPRPVKIKAKVWAQHPLEKLEVIYNGRPAISGKVSPDRLSALIDEDLSLESSGWIALRAVGPAPANHIGSNLGAHTSPIYVEVKDRPLDAADDARFFLGWIDRLETALHKRNRIPAGLDHVEMQLAAARSVYQKIVKGDKPSAR
jgi:hypothetical protein